MQIMQKPKFQPITIVLETAEEAEWLWELADGLPDVVTEEQRRFYKNLSDWFCQQAQLGD